MRSLVLLLLMSAPAVAAGQPRLSQGSFAALAIDASDPTVRLDATLGQAFAGLISSPSLDVGAGFWFGPEEPQGTALEPDATGELPAKAELRQNYPNPFNPRTVVSYAIPRRTRVRLTVHDALGREVALLVDRQQPAGRYRIPFEPRSLSSGVYFYRLEAGTTVRVGTMHLLK